MATLISLKRRIKTARNVSKTTKAMQMISASKLKRAQEAATASKPYVDKLNNLSKSLSERVEDDDKNKYMMSLPSKSILYIVISPDKGLCGGLVTNLIREILKHDSGSKNYYITLGKKAENYVTSLNKDVIASFPFGTTLPQFDTVYPIAKLVDDYFLTEKVGQVKIISTKFSGVFTQTPDYTDLLPVKFEENSKNNSLTLFEPSAKVLLPDLLRHYIEMLLFQSLLESYASEQAARMVAMKNATDNALDIISDLQLEYNKTRQEKITNELLDITGGSISLNE